MDLQSLYYFKELTKDLNISKCAERMHISPQTLSNHILRVEKAYGVKLFQRAPIFCLTDAGGLMLNFAEHTLAQESELKSAFVEISQQQMGIIRFGTLGVRADCAMPYILREFSQRYPKVRIQLTDSLSSSLREKLKAGELDFALCTITQQDPELLQEFVVPYKIYICISDELLEKHYGSAKEAMKKRLVHGAHLADLDKVPFLLLTTENVIGRTIEKCIKDEGVTPIKYMAAAYTSLAPIICKNSMAACFMSQTYLQSSLLPPTDNVNVFPLLYKGKPAMQVMALLRRKEKYLPEYSQAFITMLEKCFKDLQHVEVAHIVDR